jgi:hypothetical protein
MRKINKIKQKCDLKPEDYRRELYTYAIGVKMPCMSSVVIQHNWWPLPPRLSSRKQN